MSSPQISRVDLIADLKRLHDELGHPPRTVDINEHGEYSHRPYYDRFGGMEDALIAADIPPHSRVRTGSNISEEDLIEELRRLGEKLGRPPKSVDVKEHGKYAQPTYYNHFENFAEALEKAGFPAAPGNLIPEESLFEALHDLADELGRPPKHDEMNVQGRYRASTYQDRFGSWKKALKEAGLND